MTANIEISEGAIRHQYDERDKRWYFSIVDTVALATSSSDPRNYWKVLKSRLNKTNPQLVTKCNQLKMPSSDGKNYLTDVADSDTLLEIIKPISSDYFLPLRLYFEKIEATYPQPKTSFLEDLENTSNITLPVDMYQTNSEIVLIAFVDGSQPEDIFISVNYKSITIQGKRVSRQEKQGHSIQEIYWGVFSRHIELPAEIQIDKVEATIDHGSLVITLPKIDTLRKRIIKPKPL